MKTNQTKALRVHVKKLKYITGEGSIVDQYLAGLTTEQVNEKTKNIDECSTDEMLRLINEQDAKVPGAVKAEIPNIARAVDLIYGSLKNGGRLFYIGAGTSGRRGRAPDCG